MDRLTYPYFCDMAREENYPASEWPHLYEKLSRIDPHLMKEFVDYIENKHYPMENVCGITFAYLTLDYGMPSIEAILMMDRLLKNPQTESYLLQQRHPPMPTLNDHVTQQLCDWLREHGMSAALPPDNGMTSKE